MEIVYKNLCLSRFHYKKSHQNLLRGLKDVSGKKRVTLFYTIREEMQSAVNLILTNTIGFNN